MSFREKLSERVQMTDIHEIVFLTQNNNKRKRELYDLLFDNDDKIAYQAAWIFTHFSLAENKWLYDKQNEIIDEALICRHPGKRRLLLALILRQPLPEVPRTDFLDFCLDKMISKQELPGVQTICMKLAYEMSRHIPELKQELFVTLDMMEPDLLQISMRTVRKNVLKAMKTGKSIQL
ncbi:MAG: hypothetical protein LBV74_02340 [Tannerella sp.]|jgi:hypothetical protein|nr:hypothetical protein [Tannerella sp.]